jgi:hypothetical protein
MKMNLTHKQPFGIFVYVGNYGTYELPLELCKTEGILNAGDRRTKLGKLVVQWGKARDEIERVKHELNR